MSKFAAMAALMLVTAYAAYCLVTYPNTDVHFTQAAYFSGAIAVILVFVELIRMILRGAFDSLEWMRARRHARQDAKANKVLGDQLRDRPAAIRTDAIGDPVLPARNT